jgi:prepilin-type N-terminal cleavage/methylation domain-containing protein/prepilin-type processing-associated H-X9-DG protein
MKESFVSERPGGVKNRMTAQQFGFTLVELLVVIAIIGLLMGILMPSLNKARLSAYCTKAASNMHDVSIAIEVFASDFGFYPPSYLYPKNVTVEDPMAIIGDQDEAHSNGYLHWSNYLFDSGKVDVSAFTCPAVKNGGPPRTNPGKKAKDWEKGQVDQLGNTGPNPLQDRQATRCAFAANAAIIPRNKFKEDDVSHLYPRHNRLVKPNEIKRPGEVILLTEFNENWQTLGVQEGGGVLVKSHRPILPFTHIGTGYKGYAVYEALTNQCCYEYGDGSGQNGNWGLKPWKDIQNQDNRYLDGDSGHQLNAVGRHHPGTWKLSINGKDEDMGGTTMFLYCDGHTERKPIIDTLKNLEWGKQFYSITGDQMVRY